VKGPIENIIECREQGGAFTDLFDFCARVDGRKVNKRALDALIRSGALDEIGPEGEIGYRRAVMLAGYGSGAKNGRTTGAGCQQWYD
jgi:DNA polymerase-3 subunit alpha